MKTLILQFSILFSILNLTSSAQVQFFKLPINSTDSTQVTISEVNDNDGNTSYYTIKSDSNYVEFYSIHFSNNNLDYFDCYALKENISIDGNLKFLKNDTLFINKSHYLGHTDNNPQLDDSLQIDAFQTKYVAFRFKFNGQFQYGWIKIQGLNLIKCTQYVNNMCISSIHIPALSFESYSYKTDGSAIVTGSGTAKKLVTNIDYVNFKDFDFEVFPNPVQNEFRINSANGKFFHLHNLDGKLILSNILPNQYIDISGLKKGTYIISSPNSTKAFKLIKK